MPITIRNKKTEELIRTIGRRTGEGPSAVVARLASDETQRIDRNEPPPEEVVKARIREMEESRIRHTHPDDPKLSWSDIEKAMDSIFGDELSNLAERH